MEILLLKTVECRSRILAGNLFTFIYSKMWQVEDRQLLKRSNIMTISASLNEKDSFIPLNCRNFCNSKCKRSEAKSKIKNKPLYKDTLNT